MSKIKKRLASKVAATALGKAVLHKAMGKQGASVLIALKILIRKMVGRKEAREKLAILYKLCYKLEIVFKKTPKLREEFQKKYASELLEMIEQLIEAIDIDEKVCAGAKPDGCSIFETSESLSTRSLTDRSRLRSEETGELSFCSENTPESAKVHNLRAKYCVFRSKLVVFISEVISGDNADSPKSLFDFLADTVIPELCTSRKFEKEKALLKMKMGDFMMLNSERYSIRRNTRLSSEEFREQYQKEIDQCSNYWSALGEDKARFALSFFNQMINLNSKYYNFFYSCIDGGEGRKQHALLIKVFDSIFGRLEDWSDLRKDIVDKSARYPGWAPGLEKEMYEDGFVAFNRAMAKNRKDYLEDRVYESFFIILRLVKSVLEDSYV